MNIVIISGQLGSLSDVVAAIVARKKGYRLIGPEQIHERANVCDVEYADACTMYETETGPGLIGRIFFDSPSYNSLFQSLTYEFASEGNVVIMGRGAQFILRDIPGVFRLRVVAPTRLRVQRIKERYGIASEEASKLVRKHDRQRLSLLQSVFDHDIEDWSLFDMILNTSHFSADGAAETVCNAHDSMERAPQPENIKEKLAAMALAKRIETVIRKRLGSSVAHGVEVTGEPGGLMIISGDVREKANKSNAEKIAKEFAGVTSVKNELKSTQLTFGV